MRIDFTTLDQKHVFLSRGPDLNTLYVAERDIRTELRKLFDNPSNQLIELAARPDSMIPLETASAIFYTLRHGTARPSERRLQ